MTTISSTEKFDVDSLRVISKVNEASLLIDPSEIAYSPSDAVSYTHLTLPTKA